MDQQTISPVPGTSCFRSRDWALVLTKWFDENKRELPWRKSLDPYAVWISEIMLQQTRIEAVIPYYERFMERFPDAETLAEADEEEVLKYWEGLGYYSRARNLHKAAKEIAAVKAFPCTKEAWMKLPGIGEYTAGAISAIAFGEEVTAIDGNVMRVMSRLYALTDNVLEPASKKQVAALLTEDYPHGHASSFVQGLMELGETVCLPGEPHCEMCPLVRSCLAFKKGMQNELPVRIKKTKRTIEDRIVVIVRNDEGKLLVFQRPKKGVLAGLYELPNILKPEAQPCSNASAEAGGSNETDRITKAMKAAYGLCIIPDKLITRTRHVFTHITWNLDVYEGHVELPKEEDDEKLIFSDQGSIMLPTAFKKLL